jgi:hypothetical protein
MPPEATGRAGNHSPVHEVGVGDAACHRSAACQKAKNEDQAFHHHLLFAPEITGMSRCYQTIFLCQ